MKVKGSGREISTHSMERFLGLKRWRGKVWDSKWLIINGKFA